MNKKTILATGGAGFIGTNFIRHALAVMPDWRIINLDALTYAGNPANLEDLSPEHAERYRFIRGDIGDISLLEKLFSEENVDGVIHFAAESHVDRSILGPEAFLNTNVIGTFRLLEARPKISAIKERSTFTVKLTVRKMRRLDTSNMKSSQDVLLPLILWLKIKL